jgi:hypothetical protein
MNAYGGVEVQASSLLTAALDGFEWLASRTKHFTPAGLRVRLTLEITVTFVGR